MTLEGVVAAIVLLLATSAAAALVGKSDRAARVVGSLGGIAGCGLGLAASLAALLRGDESSVRVPWSLSAGELHLGLDPLSSFFLVCVFLVSGLSAVYAHGYLGAYLGRQRLVSVVALTPLLTASMAGVVLARDGVLFLVTWEGMSIASFLLVTWEHERSEVRRAGMTYLIASQSGVALLFVLFALLAREAGSFDFDRVVAAGPPRAALVPVCFLLAVVGFGSKAGFWPIHVWLPDAHPAAPSPISATMSGVMVKIGVYGLLRVIGFLGEPAPWWGGLLVAVGVVSGTAGILHALAQRDLKRVLAYSSVENVGLIVLGVGVGMLGRSGGVSAVAVPAFAGALLHVLNHGLFKGLLFQAAGNVAHAAATRDLETLGGLARRMPATALAFLVGSLAICGLPPFNGFVSEWLIYMGALRGGALLTPRSGVVAVMAVPVLALIGALALACFVRAYGVAFLGDARTPAATRAHEPVLTMRAPMLAAAVLCALLGVWPTGALRLVASPAEQLAGVTPDSAGTLGSLPGIARAFAGLLALVAGLAWVRVLLLRGRTVRADTTWGCGYAAPSPRMQYSASSFAEPLLLPFGTAVPRHVLQDGPSGYYPLAARYEERTGDVAGERLLLPAVRRFVDATARLRVIQQGRVQMYLMYLLVALVGLLAWQLGGPP